MNITTRTENNTLIAVIETAPKELVITDAQTALDVAMTARYELGASRIVFPKSAVCNDFFVLSTGLAGEILQKFVNYQMKVAFWGDYSHYTSKPLKDFMGESNRGHDVFFTATEAEAVARLAGA